MYPYGTVGVKGLSQVGFDVLPIFL